MATASLLLAVIIAHTTQYLYGNKTNGSGVALAAIPNYSPLHFAFDHARDRLVAPLTQRGMSFYLGILFTFQALRDVTRAHDALAKRLVARDGMVA